MLGIFFTLNFSLCEASVRRIPFLRSNLLHSCSQMRFCSSSAPDFLEVSNIKRERLAPWLIIEQGQQDFTGPNLSTYHTDRETDLLYKYQTMKKRKTEDKIAEAFPSPLKGLWKNNIDRSSKN